MGSTNKKLNIVYAANDRFAEILGVSLISLYENNKDMEEIQVYIFDSDISQVNKEKLESIFAVFSNVFANKRLLNYSFVELVLDIGKNALMSIIMCFAVILIGYVLALYDVNLLFVLIIEILVGISIYLLMAVLSKSEELKIITEYLARMVKRK